MAAGDEQGRTASWWPPRAVWLSTLLLAVAGLTSWQAWQVRCWLSPAETASQGGTVVRAIFGPSQAREGVSARDAQQVLRLVWAVTRSVRDPGDPRACALDVETCRRLLPCLGVLRRACLQPEGDAGALDGLLSHGQRVQLQQESLPEDRTRVRAAWPAFEALVRARCLAAPPAP